MLKNAAFRPNALLAGSAAADAGMAFWLRCCGVIRLA
jgi:hypothetical protein